MENTTLAPETAALCVDGRATKDFAGRGLMALDLIEGLGSHIFAEDGPLILAHPQQELTAPFRRANTRKLTGSRWFGPRWEKKFVATQQIAWFHRFLPLDKVNHPAGCALITTLLSPQKKMPFYVSRKNRHQYVVPSQADADWLEKNYSVPLHQITVIRPAPRRSVVGSAGFSTSGERGIVVVRDGWKDGFDRHVSVIRRSFPQARLATVNLREADTVAPDRWLRTLQNAQACFYLVQKPFDWPTLALEALFWDVPLLYSDGNKALGELLPSPKYKLHSFLAEPSSLTQLITLGEQARETLEEENVFDPDAQAVAYRELYLKLGALSLA